MARKTPVVRHLARRATGRVAILRPRPRARPRAGRTGDHRHAFTTLRAIALAHGFRVGADREGWPVIPGKLGQVEWYDGTMLAVYTDRPRLIARLWAIPGVRRWQVGDQEVRGLFQVASLPAAAAVIRARRRRIGRPLTSDQALRLRANARARATLAAQELA